MTRVAIIGLGAMGSRIAARLLAADHEVIGLIRKKMYSVRKVRV